MPKMLIPSKLSELPKAQQAILDPAEALGYNKDELFAIRLSLDEAISNAIVHGNQNDADKKVAIEYTVDEDAVSVTVTDEGKGFSPDNLPDPTLEENLTTPHGRGVMLISAYMTEAEYVGCGNCIRMVKRRGCKLPRKD